MVQNAMRTFLCAALLLAPFAAGADDRPERDVRDKKLQGRIHDAIARGADYLKSTQRKDGRWPSKNPQAHDGGLTALALYALAASKVPARDPAIRRGLFWVTTHREPYSPGRMYGTYSASLLVMALTRIDARKHRDRIHELARLLVQSQLRSGMWNYTLSDRLREGARMRGGGGDNSNAQFAIVALWAAATLAEFEVPRTTWQRVKDLYQRTQVSGGWGYRHGANRTASMTAAGLCAYVYADTALGGNANRTRRSTRVRQGLEALRRFGLAYHNYYYVYALERVGNVLDLPLKTWYVDGAKHLVKRQRSSGQWDGQYVDENGTFETSMALLFLTRATLAPPPRAAVTKRETFPDPAEPRGLERAFGFYVEYNARDRAKIASRFGAAGASAVGLFIEKLRHKSERTRTAAYELLTTLVDARFFYEPQWPLDTRRKMLVPIDAWWQRNAKRLRWDGERFTTAP